MSPLQRKLIALCLLCAGLSVACGMASVVFNNRIVELCILEQVKNYGDLCAESSSGYEQMSGKSAHFDGVNCAVQSIQLCLEEHQ